MQCRRIMLTLAVLLVPVIQGQAAECQKSDLLQRVEALPDFIVVPQGKPPNDVLTQVLGCSLPPLDVPKLANGETVSPTNLVGKNVLDLQGNSVGVVKGIVMQRNGSSNESPVAAIAPSNGATMLAVPTNQMAEGKQTLVFSGMSEAHLPSMQQFLKQDNYNASTFSVVPTSMFEKLWSYNPMIVSFDRVLIWIDSDPTGANVFIRDINQGPTEIQGFLRLAYRESIRLEMKGYRPCHFHDGTYELTQFEDPPRATFRCKLTAIPTNSK